MSRTRRQILTAGAALVGTALVGSTASAQEGDWLPDHVVAAGDDVESLEPYQPKLVTTPADRAALLGFYGCWMDSAEYDERVYLFWARYTHQDSSIDAIPFLGDIFARDSHLGDHEPYALFADRQTGEVKRILYSGYHHYGVSKSKDEIELVADATAAETHPVLDVVSPHHHYQLVHEDRGVLPSTFTGLESFLEAHPRWRDRDVWRNADLESVTDPWHAEERGYWWKDGTRDARMAWLRVALDWRDSDHDELIRA
ncbi:hypothetical protein [Natronosalvus halobius]|uniref:hypothetical protein n=1 Tax=Natronosalvus halobius TaxID=2953746 RepID=UPI0020A1ECD9|nr:hypothetical protein [Natronosalvus halobius]USZ73797.1 hypothetical protein NGM15_18495 [Natronosalvus halobius]